MINLTKVLICTSIAITVSTPIGVEGRGWWGAMKWWTKATLTLKQPSGVH